MSHAVSRSLLLGALLTASVGCASGPAPRVIRASELGSAPPLEPGQAVIVEFLPGDRIPLSVTVGGPLVHTPEDLAPIQLEVVRRFFLRLDEDGLATSLDGKTFGDHVEKGSFQFGVGVTKAGANATIGIRTPTPREP
jgi:hypothetical protein